MENEKLSEEKHTSTIMDTPKNHMSEMHAKDTDVSPLTRMFTGGRSDECMDKKMKELSD